jgi:hypothetical protein
MVIFVNFVKNVGKKKTNKKYKELIMSILSLEHLKKVLRR